MAEYLNPTTDVDGTDGDDKVVFNQPVSIPPGQTVLNVNGAGGVDALMFDVAGTGGLRFQFSLYDANYNGRIGSVSGDDIIAFADFETFELTGSASDDVFQFYFKNGPVSTTLDFNGAGGTDTLDLDYSQSGSGISFIVNGDGTVTTPLGNFANFENFVILGSREVDTITTGSGNDTITTITNTPIGLPQAQSDTVNAGAGDDTVYASSQGTFDGGAGYDRIGVSLIGPGAGYGNQVDMLIELGSTVTISNGTTITNFEEVKVNSGAGNDRFEISEDGNFFLDGGFGRDALVSSVTLDGPQDFYVSSFSAAQKLSGHANHVFYDWMDVVFFDGGSFDDVFQIDGNFSADQISLNGAGGSDLLKADFSTTSGPLQFEVSVGGAITSNRGTFLSFERFDLTGTYLDDIITTGTDSDTINGGAGSDVITTGNAVNRGEPDVVNAGDGDDVVNAFDPGTFDGGSGIDTFNGQYGGLLGNSDVTPLTFVIDGDITISNGTTITGFERGDLSSSAGDDSFFVYADAEFGLSGRAGTDRLTVAVDTAGPQTFTAAGDSAGGLGGTANSITFGSMEVIDFTGSPFDDSFEIAWTYGADQVIFDGGAGSDFLKADFSRFVDANVFEIAADGSITNNRGTFVSFEQFELFGGAWEDRFVTGDGDDRLWGGAGDDYLSAGAGNDWLTGDEGVDTMIGGLGDDRYYVYGTEDIIVEKAGEGFDTILSTVSFTIPSGLSIEALTSISAADLTLTGNELDNIITGADGADTLIGGLGADTLDGSTGIDTVSYVGDGAAVFVNLTLGQGFTNASFGDTYVSIENVIGSSADDFIIGDTGVNRLDGGDGNDILLGAFGADTIIGGAGNDWASYEENSGTVFVNLTLGRGYNNGAEGDTLEGIENLVGGLFDDFFIGDENGNRLNGAMGADTLLGAGGADVFMFTYAPGATSDYGSPNVDLILDFTTGEDVIELSSAAFAGLSAGALADGAFFAGSAAHDADDRIIYDSATGQLWFDADGDGAGAAMLFATLGESSHPATIAASDFVVV